MTPRQRVGLLFAFWIGPAAVAFAEPAAPPASPFTFSGSVRVRFESIEGQPRAGFNASDSIVDLRTKLRGEYRFDAATSVVGEIFDSRVEGEDAGSPITTSEVNTFELVQAYVETKHSFGPVKAVGRLGRFTLNMGAGRLVATDDYRNTTTGFTGARLLLQDGPISGDFVYVLPQRRLPDDLPALRRGKVELDKESSAVRLYVGVASTALFGARIEGTAIRFEERDQSDAPTRDRRLTTLGLRLVRAPKAGAWDFDVEGLHQTGSVSASLAPGAQKLDVGAGYAHAALGKTFAAPWSPRVAFEYDWSGGDEPGGKYERFDSLFASRRSELAPAGLYSAVARANIEAAGVRLEVKPNVRSEAFIAVKSLRLASATDAFSQSGVRDPSGAAGKDAGLQIDARVRYWIVPDKWRVDANVLRLQKGDFFDRAPNAAHNGDTTYVAFDLTRTF